MTQVVKCPTAEAFEQESLRQIELSATPFDKQTIVELIKVAKDFQGLFSENDSVMFFSRETARTRTARQILNMHWYRRLLRHLFKQYATGPNNSALIEDFTRLCEDSGDLMKAIGKFAPDAAYGDVAKKRFREANLFMPNSNGDQYVSEDEAVYYVAMLVSAGSLTSRTWDRLTEQGKKCPIIGTDEIGEPAIAIDCFRDQYFGHMGDYLSQFPDLMQGYHDQLDSDGQLKFIRDLEVAGRKNGFSDRPIGGFDIDSYSALVHYVEAAVIRFDSNGDEILDRDEILNNIYPIFALELSTVPNAPEGELMLKGLLTYLFKFKKVPETKAEKAHFVWWISKRWVGGNWSWGSIEGTRFDVYGILALLTEAG
ncbi:MAG: hypothetical protein EOP09_11110 [Proteobacteria bacterium]|nr:MAG: hypothetical protein EOP09_11110 [Pseudomonadota bacterium]